MLTTIVYWRRRFKCSMLCTKKKVTKMLDIKKKIISIKTLEVRISFLNNRCCKGVVECRVEVGLVEDNEVVLVVDSEVGLVEDSEVVLVEDSTRLAEAAGGGFVG